MPRSGSSAAAPHSRSSAEISIPGASQVPPSVSSSGATSSVLPDPELLADDVSSLLHAAAAMARTIESAIGARQTLFMFPLLV